MGTMKRIVAPTETGADWKRLLAKPDLHWKPGKSAMSAAACWEAAGNRLPPEVSAALTASRDPDLASQACPMSCRTAATVKSLLHTVASVALLDVA